MAIRHLRPDTRPTSVTESALKQAAQADRIASAQQGVQLLQPAREAIRGKLPFLPVLERARAWLNEQPWYVRAGALASPLAVLGAGTVVYLLIEGIGFTGVACIGLGAAWLSLGQEVWRRWVRAC